MPKQLADVGAAIPDAAIRGLGLKCFAGVAKAEARALGQHAARIWWLQITTTHGRRELPYLARLPLKAPSTLVRRAVLFSERPVVFRNSAVARERLEVRSWILAGDEQTADMRGDV